MAYGLHAKFVSSEGSEVVFEASGVRFQIYAAPEEEKPRLDLQRGVELYLPIRERVFVELKAIYRDQLYYDVNGKPVSKPVSIYLDDQSQALEDPPSVQLERADRFAFTVYYDGPTGSLSTVEVKGRTVPPDFQFTKEATVE